MSHRNVLFLCPAVILTACTDANSPDLSPCTEPVTLTFAVAPAPTLSWDPNCRVDQVLVEVPLPPSAGGGFDVTWQLAAPVDGQGTGGPVRYGIVPQNMDELVPPEPLQVGAFYRMRIFADDVSVGEVNVQYWPPD